MLKDMAEPSAVPRHEAHDPVCGMTVDPATAAHRSYHDSKTYYFCSAGCKESFDDDPEKYLAREPGKIRH